MIISWTDELNKNGFHFNLECNSKFKLTLKKKKLFLFYNNWKEGGEYLCNLHKKSKKFQVDYFYFNIFTLFPHESIQLFHHDLDIQNIGT